MLAIYIGSSASGVIDLLFQNPDCVAYNAMPHFNYAEDQSPSTKAILIDQTPTFRDGTPFTRPISKYKTSHFSFRDIVFEYKQSDFPYDLKIKMTFQCPNETVTTHNFDQKLKFRMVYPTQRL